MCQEKRWDTVVIAKEGRKTSCLSDTSSLRYKERSVRISERIKLTIVSLSERTTEQTLCQECAVGLMHHPKAMVKVMNKATDGFHDRFHVVLELFVELVV